MNRLRNIRGNKKRSNKCIIRVPERKDKESGDETYI